MFEMLTMLIDFIDVPPDRLLRIYFLNFPLGVFLIILGLLIKRRAKTTPQLFFITVTFVAIGLGACSNAVYVRFDSLLLQTIGNKLGISLITIGVMNLALFCISLKTTRVVFRIENTALYEVIVVALAAVYYLIPIEFDANYSPYWPPGFLIYSILLTQSSFIISLVFLRMVWKVVEDPLVKKRLLFFGLGLCGIYVLLLDLYLVNGHLMNIPLLRSLSSIFFVPGMILIYYGIGKDLKPKEKDSMPEKKVEVGKSESDSKKS